MDDMEIKDIESSERNYIPPEVNDQNSETGEAKITNNQTNDNALISEATTRKEFNEISINSVEEKKENQN
jgi:hypothetical protein